MTFHAAAYFQRERGVMCYIRAWFLSDSASGAWFHEARSMICSAKACHFGKSAFWSGVRHSLAWKMCKANDIESN